MPTDHSLDARRAIVERLRGVPEISSIVKDRVYGPKVPANPVYPMLKVGLMIPGPFEATCIDGMSAAFNVYCISKADDEGEAATLSRLVVNNLDQDVFPLDESEGSHVLSLDWTGTTPRHEHPLWHMMASFRLITQEEA